jgi:hypothetical protein
MFNTSSGAHFKEAHMWVMTSWGVLMPGLRPEGTIPEGDNRVLQVRARRKKDLEMLRDKYMGDELGDIISLPHTDYEWRAYSTLEAWGRALAKIGEDIDYVKFKETAEKVYDDHDLHGLYLSVWSTIFAKLSTQQHQDDYWSAGSYYGMTGKYGTSYPGTGSFTYAAKPKGKGKKSRGKARINDRDYSVSVGGGRQPWWADAASEGPRSHWWDDDDAYRSNPYRDDLDDLGLGAVEDIVGFNGLMSMLQDLDPAEKPVFTADNQIDHLYCDHGISKSAKKRCRARWRRYANTRIKREFGAARS